MKKSAVIFASIFSIFLYACEDVIDIELNSVEARLVIEAKLYDQLLPATVILTKTNDFFDSLTYNSVSGAEIYISDNIGNRVRIPETDSVGIYQLEYFGEIGKTYTLTIESEGELYIASAKMKPSLKIDSLSVKYHNAGIPYFEAGYELTCHIKDSANVSEYALLNLYQNFEPSFNIYLFEDTYVDGLGFAFKFFADNFQTGDTALVQMLSCEKNVYDYLLTYAEIAGDFYDSGGTPYNPTSNISNNALGYFGVFSLNGAFMIIEE